MRKVTDIIKEKGFVLSAELVPPRNGTSLEPLFAELEKLRQKVDFISVTKGAGGSLRGGSLPITFYAQQKFSIPAIAHYVCRERTCDEIENDLIDLDCFGIKNILALRGDPPAGQVDKEWNGDYHYAYELVSQIKRLNNGIYLPRTGADEKERSGRKTDFCIIAAAHPEDPPEIELQHIRAKLDAGAEALITQMVFSFEEYVKYVESLRKDGITVPIIPGIRPLVSIDQAISCERFFRVKVADELKGRLQSAATPDEAYKAAVDYFRDLISRLKQSGAPGVHLFLINDFKVLWDLVR